MYFDINQLYAETNQGLSVFEFYFSEHSGRLTDSRFKFKERATEKSASAQISLYKNLWRITDFGNQGEVNSLSAIDYVMYKEALSYYDAIQFIYEIVLRKSPRAGFRAAVRKPDYSKREPTPDDKVGEYKFVFKKPTDVELGYFGRYVTEFLLTQFRCKTVDSYEYCAIDKGTNSPVVHQYKSTADFPVFLFDYGTFKKLYRPMELEKRWRFIYIGTKPKNYIFGLDMLLRTPCEFNTKDEEQIAEEEEEEEKKEETPDEADLYEDVKEKKIVKDLFRCSGESDAINVASLGFHVYWLNSESTAVDGAQFHEVDQYCERHYQIMDLDATGQAEAAKNAMKFIDLYTIALPSWLSNKKDWRGNPCKDCKDFINTSGKTLDETKYDFLVLKTNARRVRFWDKTKDKSGKRSYNFTMEHFYFFLKLNGFYKVLKSYTRKSDYMYAKFDDKVFRLISPDRIKTEVKEFTKHWIENRKMLAVLPLLEKINASVQITEANLEMLPETDINFRNCANGLEWMHFNSGMSFKITPEEIKLVRQREVPNFILGELKLAKERISHIIPHNVRLLEQSPIEVLATPDYQALMDKLAAATTSEQREEINIELGNLPEIDRYTVKVNDKDFFFVRFLQDLARIHWRKELENGLTLTETERKEQDLALANLLFVYGYLASEYKDPSKPWIVTTMDNKISEVGQSSGRSGKSLKTMGVRHVRPVFCKGGRNLDKEENFKFLYDGYTEFHNNIEIDDFAEYGQFSYLYTQITGSREINPKNYSSFTLEYAHSGKMSISTNFELMNTDSSTVARILYESASDYYHEKSPNNNYLETRSPAMKFGRRLYDDFTPDEWTKFYNLIAYCIQLQMRFYKINPPMGNITKRELRREMQRGVGKTDDFFKWANCYFQHPADGFDKEFAPAETGYLNTYIVKDWAFDEFTKTLTPRQKNDYRMNHFKAHLQAWCRYHDYDFNPDTLVSDQNNKRILRKVDGKTKECFFIATSSDQDSHAGHHSSNEEDLPF